jgi:hypothetical protein
MMSRPVVLAFLAFLAPVVAGGCHVGSVTSADNAEATVSNPYQPDASDAGGYGAADEPSPAAPTTQGSPLCNASVAGG